MKENNLYEKPKKVPSNKRNGWKYFLCLFAGFTMGVVGSVGGVVYATTRISTGQIMSAFGQDPNAVLSEKYQNQSLYTFVLSMVRGEADFTTLDGIRQVTPLVDSVVDKVGVYLEKYTGVTLTTDDIVSLQLEEIPTFLITKVKKEAKIAVLLDINEDSDPLLKMLAFHRNEDGSYDYDSPRELSEFTEPTTSEGGSVIGGTESIISEIISEVTVGEVMDVKEGDLLYEFKDTKISDLEEEVKNTPINKLIKFDENTPNILRALGNYTFNTLAEGIKNLTVMDIFGMDAYNDQNQIIQALFFSKITDLSDAVKTLPLSTFVGVGEDIPYALQRILNKTKVDPETGEARPYTISELAECYRCLTVGDLVDYNNPDIKNNKLLSSIDQNTLLEDLPNAFNNITLGNAFHDDIYENGKIRTMWEYLLHNPDTDASIDSDATDEEKYSGLNLKLNEDFNILLDNMKKNTMTSTIRELYQHGLIDLKDPSVLDKHVIGDTKKLGDYTYSEFINRIANSGLLVD